MQLPTEFPPLFALLHLEIGALCYHPPQKAWFINGTLLNKSLCMTLTHQYFHFWSPASRLFASASPLCDWAICQKKSTSASHFRVRTGVYTLSKLKFRHKIPQTNTLQLRLLSISKRHRRTIDFISMLLLPCIIFCNALFSGTVKYLSTLGTLVKKRKYNSHYPDENNH